MTASFERFDYQLRSNKHVERKLVFDLLLRARKFFPIENYKYLGLGSMWFADHRLAHRLLNIGTLISIEAEEHAERAEFNKPYKSITVLPGMSHAVLPNFTDADWVSPIFAWMDYDGNLNHDVEADLSRFILKMAPGSVLLMTVNANFLNYKTRQNAVESAAARGEVIDPRAVAKLIRFLGNVVPNRFQIPNEAGRLLDATATDFPEVMAESILAFLIHKVTASGRIHNGAPLKFVPLFNICHQDGVEMITVGGSISAESDVALWEATLASDPVLRVGAHGPLHHRLDLIPITLREKLALDALLPSEEAIGEAAVECGVRVGDDQVEKYRVHYRHFPMFFEAPV